MGMEHHVADLIQLLAPPKMSYSCVVRGPHRSSLPAQLSGVAQDRSEQRRSQEAGGPVQRFSLRSRSSASLIFGMYRTGTGRSLGNPSLHTYHSYFQFKGPGLNFTGNSSFFIRTTINLLLPHPVFYHKQQTAVVFLLFHTKRREHFVKVFYYTYFLLI